MRVLLDTNAYSAFSRRPLHGRLFDEVTFAEQVVLPATVIGELYSGFYSGKRFEENVRQLGEFLDDYRVAVAPIDEETGIKFGRIESELRTLGVAVPTNDIWIAATAFQHGLKILTFDRHFGQIPFVDVSLFDA